MVEATGTDGLRHRVWALVKREGVVLAALVALALGLRTLSALTRCAINIDAPAYLRMAETFAQGMFVEALDMDAKPPLYQWLVGLGVAAGLPVEETAIFLSVILSSLALVPLYVLAREAWGGRVAALAGLLYAGAPVAVKLGSEAYVDPTFHFLLLSTLALLWIGVMRGRAALLAISGVTGALAALTRTEGIAVVPLAAVACVVGWKGAPGAGSRRAVVGGLLAGLLLGAVVFSPYAGYVRSRTGSWGVTAHSAVGRLGSWLVGRETGATGDPEKLDCRSDGERALIARGGIVGGGALIWADGATKSASRAGVPLLLLGLVTLRRPLAGGRAAVFLLTAAAAMLLPPYLMLLSGGWFVYRFVFPGVLLLYPLMGVGLDTIVQWVSRRGRTVRFTAAGATVVVIAIALVRIASPSHESARPWRDAGSFILERHGPGRSVAAPDVRVMYYARGVGPRFLGGAAEVPAFAAQSGVEFLVLEERLDLPEFVPEAEFAGRHGPVAVYRRAGPSR